MPQLRKAEVDQSSSAPAAGRHRLLTRARQQRVAWIEAARGDPEAGKVARNHAQRESEQALSQSVAARTIPSAVQTVRFLNQFLSDGEPVVTAVGGAVSAEPLALDAPIPTHAPGLSWFDVLLDKLKHPAAAEIVTSLQRFVTSFLEQDSAELTREDPEKAPAMIHSFLQRTEGQMRENVLWKGETPAQWEDSREAIERFVFHKLYDEVFRGVVDTLAEQDRAVDMRIQSLAFLKSAHLDIDVFASGQDDSLWEPAARTLRDMHNHRCPAGKLDCIVQCSKIITRLLSDARRDGTPPGADEFLPALILVLKLANPPSLHSNMHFVQYYRHSSKLVSEAGYIFTNLLSAAQFLESVTETSLTISVEEFRRGIAESGKKAAMQLRSSAELSSRSPTERAPVPDSAEKTVHEIRAMRLQRQLRQPPACTGLHRSSHTELDAKRRHLLRQLAEVEAALAVELSLMS